MLLSQKVQAIEEVFALLDQEMSQFRGWSGLTCKAGCGKCCTKADIEATVLEFLPFALHVYHLQQSAYWLARLEQHAGSLCVFFEPTQPGSGLCSEYPFRGLICRLFGFSARTNKYAKKEFITCQTISIGQPEHYTSAVNAIAGGSSIPVMNQYYMRLHGIDRDLARDFYPINEAIRRAIETVLHHYAYKE